LGADLGNFKNDISMWAIGRNNKLTEGKVMVESLESSDSATEGAIRDGVAGRTSDPALTCCKDSLSIASVSIDSAVGSDGVIGYWRITS
jgi:hypothetical protein